MSWTANLVIEDGEIIDSTNFNADTDEHAEQYEQAVAAVNAIIESGAVGDKARRFSIILSGHGNPDHKPTPGWANDHISINIVQGGTVE